ncbi:uncharacterized protein Z518_05916 [Rhinocladiella mackenziei CBS 650.93]|uniref:SWR1-complex protein 4 n=1 Tax=Rhinocladiella mackenziei CBS 650.93 TaxID=1442369 RepID=A0A0D2IH14_9EURO|nr:uncharacterized protein Z518_05916 [Rhinocladiella mackenziei CBS 650.93]KIX05044.1 hypothetical protein Z518_05916 [Rhinocladiella mackenziei CBS 650.93]
MASTSDIRDIMNLGQTGPRQPAPKKKKHIEPQIRVTGVKREVQALMGDSVPPIAIVEQRSYKSRPSISQKLFKPRHWEERPFQHGGRTDGLVLRHWKRSIPGSNARAPPVASITGSTDVDMADEPKTAPAVQELRFEDEFPSHKWNVKVQIPSYTDEQYENLLKSEDWTRQETDYLMNLCRDYDLRWVIISDRYEPSDVPRPKSPPTNGEATGSEVVPRWNPPPRSMEALKQRYYSVAAHMLETQIPVNNMTQPEFQLWERMRNFDAKTEAMRKNMAEKLFDRTKDEADEERVLLEELHRITKNEDDFIKMRRDLYARLEPVTPTRRTERGEEQSTAMYQTSGGLSMLLQTLVAKEKRLKRPPLPGSAEAGPASATPADAQKWEKGRHPNQYTRRDTIDTQAEEPRPQKKGSTSQPNVRMLTPQEELRFGVSHPQERITSGVQFRHEKINRLTMAKSQTQTTKIQAALTELGIPPRLLMPTERVCREFERLTTEINVLLDCRKVNEKIATEIKILEEARRIRLGLPKEGEQPAPPTVDAMDVDSSQTADNSKIESTQDDSMAVAEGDQDAEGEDDAPAEKAEEKSEAEDDDADHENDDSGMQVDGRADEDEDEEDADAEGEEDGDAAARVPATKPAEDEEESEDDDEEYAEEEDEGEKKDEEADRSVTGVDNDEDDDEEGNEGDDGEAQAEADEDGDEDENDGEEDLDAEVAATPQNESDGEEDNDSDNEDEEEDEAESEEEEEEDANDNDSDNDSAAQADVDYPDDAPEAEAEDSDEADNATKEESKDNVPPKLVDTLSARAHKRSASVMSEASRAGSNRSGLGRKKRR